MAEIVPAILEQSLEDMAARLRSIKGAARAVQLDVVDGRYAPNVTWPYASALQRGEFARVASQEEGLPLWDAFDFEADLMLENPAREIERWVSAGFSRIIVHSDSKGAREALQELQKFRGEPPYSVGVGIALPALASADDFTPFESACDFVQVMGIDKVGFQGQPFDSRALSLVARLREKHPELPLQVDGGVSTNHVSELVRAGAGRIIEGSTIFGSFDPKQAIRELQSLAA